MLKLRSQPGKTEIVARISGFFQMTTHSAGSVALSKGKLGSHKAIF